jgi:hypothetical protein
MAVVAPPFAAAGPLKPVSDDGNSVGCTSRVGSLRGRWTRTWSPSSRTSVAAGGVPDQADRRVGDGASRWPKYTGTRTTGRSRRARTERCRGRALRCGGGQRLGRRPAGAAWLKSGPHIKQALRAVDRLAHWRDASTHVEHSGPDRACCERGARPSRGGRSLGAGRLCAGYGDRTPLSGRLYRCRFWNRLLRRARGGSGDGDRRRVPRRIYRGRLEG